MRINFWSSKCTVNAGQLGMFKVIHNLKMASEALNMFDDFGVQVARIDKAGKGVKKIELFRQLDPTLFEVVVLVSVAAWEMHRALDKEVLKGLGKALFSL